MSLKTLIATEIALSGPMGVDRFMSLALGHPEYGYYLRQDPFGRLGDFTTAPEISQMFGELVGLALAQVWLDQGAPSSFTLLELGPGRGTLMADLLRATRGVPGFHKAADLVMLESSPVLRAAQHDKLGAYEVTHIADLTDLKQQPLFCVANEFFDALPIRQFVRQETGWSERQIGVEGGALMWGLSPPLHIETLAHRVKATRTGDIVETCTPASGFVLPVADRITGSGGAALFIDYGEWQSLGDTLQALSNHAPVNPLANPGSADLTAHVDFEALLRGLTMQCSGLTPQGVFLERLGITARAQTLAQGLSGQALESHVAAHRRLTHPTEMGTLFKVVGLTPEGASPIPGLNT